MKSLLVWMNTKNITVSYAIYSIAMRTMSGNKLSSEQSFDTTAGSASQYDTSSSNFDEAQTTASLLESRKCLTKMFSTIFFFPVKQIATHLLWFRLKFHFALHLPMVVILVVSLCYLISLLFDGRYRQLCHRGMSFWLV